MVERGRGRLSSLDQLPAEAQDDLVWACQQLYARERTQADILFEFNDRLAVKGIDPVSKSAFNRKSLRIAASTRDLQETTQIYTAVAGVIDPAKIDDQTIILGEFLKNLIFGLLQPGRAELTPDDAMKLGRSFKDVSSGLKTSSDRRAQLEKKAAEKATVAIDMVAKSRGLTEETVKAIKSEILGIREDGQ